MAKISYISLTPDYKGGFTASMSISANDVSMMVHMTSEEMAPVVAQMLKIVEEKRIKAAQDLAAVTFAPALQDLSPVVEGEAMELESAEDKISPPTPAKSSDIDDIPF